MNGKPAIELHVTRSNGQRRIILLQSHITLRTAMSMAEQDVMNGTHTYAGVYVDGKVYCEYEA